MQSNAFTGVHVAMNSCYDYAGQIDPDAVRKLTRFLIDKGVQGLYVGGSTGEGMLQSVEERMKVLEAVVGETKGEVIVTAHVGAITTEASIQLAQHAAALGVDAISSVPPYYYAYSESAVKSYWTAIMASTPLPFIIYYIPSATGFHMSTAFLKEMLANERLFGIKMTTFNTHEIQQFKAAGGSRLVVINGPDQQYAAGRIMGASAGIGGTYGAMPELFLQIEKEFRQGRVAEAQRWQFIVNEYIEEIRSIGLFGAIKELIKLRGVDCGKPRLPLPGVATSQYPRVVRLYEQIMRSIQELEPSSPSTSIGNFGT